MWKLEGCKILGAQIQIWQRYNEREVLISNLATPQFTNSGENLAPSEMTFSIWLTLSCNFAQPADAKF